MIRPTATGPDAETARVVSDGFLAVARRYFGALPKDMNEAAKVAHNTRGDLAAAATSLAFAIELQLKALAIACGKTPLRKHALVDLFRELPLEWRDLIEKAYATVIPKVRSSDLGAMELWVTTTPFPPTSEEVALLSGNYADSKTVLELLERERDAFQNWRYVYESDTTGGVSLIRIEYGRLATLAKVLQECRTSVACA